MQLSVIIVNYNVRAFLENCLISVRKALSGIEAEIFVVDNASDDGSIDMVRQKFPDVHLLANDRNVGFAAANNQALRECKGDYVLLLNPDSIVQEDTFRVMIDFMEKNPEAGLAGCTLLNPDGSLQLPCRRSFPTPWVAFTKIIGLSTLFPRSRLFGRYNLTYLDPDESYPVDAVGGAFMFVRRQVVQQVGPLDEEFFMYGEDLDWCYRIQSAGWKIFYVHSTRIIHYKGESARRSDIDEVKLFYEAMRVFVRKHIHPGFFADLILRSGIAVREGIAFMAKIAKPLRAAFLDGLLVNISLLLGEKIWFGEFFHFPRRAFVAASTVPALAVVLSMFFLGVYTRRKLSITRAAGSVMMGYVIVSALTFFFNQYAFSRMVVAISGMITLILLPGWRVVSRTLLHSREHFRRSLFGRRTLIVGAEKTGQEVLRKLRARVDDGYEIVGFVDIGRKRVGEKISGVEILGSIDNIGKVIHEQKASEVIFSTDILSYSDILSVIGRAHMPTVNFRLVPSSLEVIIGKTHIDELDDIPLVDIDYNLDRLSHRIGKRLFDVSSAIFLLVVFYPFASLRKKSGEELGRFSRGVLLLPEVLRGRMSLVGPPRYSSLGRNSVNSPVYLGRPGLTGLAQINYRDDLLPAEVEKYNLYYAKNHSFALDIEILLKALLLLKR